MLILAWCLRFHEGYSQRMTKSSLDSNHAVSPSSNEFACLFETWFLCVTVLTVLELTL